MSIKHRHHVSFHKSWTLCAVDVGGSSATDEVLAGITVVTVIQDTAIGQYCSVSLYLLLHHASCFVTLSLTTVFPFLKASVLWVSCRKLDAHCVGRSNGH